MSDERIVRVPLSSEYTLILDGLGNVYIMRKAVTKKGKYAGRETEYIVGGYHTSIENCMADFHKKLVIDGEPKSLTALVKAEHDAEKKIREMYKPLNEAIKDIRKALRGK